MAFEAQQDAMADGAPSECDPFGPFTSIRALTELNGSAGDGGLRLSADERTAYFHSDRQQITNYVIWIATRPTISDPFTPPSDTGIAGYFPAVSTDELTLAYDSLTDIYVTSRTDATAAFAPATGPLADITTSTVEGAAYLSFDGTALYFGRGSDLYVASWPPPVVAQPILELDSGDVEFGPVAAADQLTLYFMHKTSSTPEEVWVAHRDSTAMPFGAAVRVDELASTSNTAPTWLSGDNCRLYFESDRGATDYNLYVAERVP